ncbi:hypothetical protein ACP3V3_02825 [Vibrio sp. PNB22_3_1]
MMVKKLKSRLPAWLKRKKKSSGKALKIDFSELFAPIDAGHFDRNPSWYYVPWIKSHGDRLFGIINEYSGAGIRPLPIFEGIQSAKQRHRISRIIKGHPDVYRRYLLKTLAPHAKRMCGVCVSLDWNLPMRLLAEVCKELCIPVVLVPHEAVFADRDRYYQDVRTGTDCPIADYVLVWGRMQKEIFVERGYPENRIAIVGAPKFDVHANYAAVFTRKMFLKLHGLTDQSPVLLFAAQPLDSQFDKKQAQLSQEQAVLDLVHLCHVKGLQLIIRMPPSDEQIFSASVQHLIDSSKGVSVDHASMYLTSPEEAISHVDVVLSVNSTMMFEALLMGKGAISTRYVEFDQIWADVGIPAVADIHLLADAIDVALLQGSVSTSEQMNWASEVFGVGEFDGKASVRIKAFLDDLIFARLPFDIDAQIATDGYGVLGYLDDSELALAEIAKEVLGLRSLRQVTGRESVASVDYMLVGHGDRYHRFVKGLNKPKVSCESFGVNAHRIALALPGQDDYVLDWVKEANRGSRVVSTLEYLETRLLPSGQDWQGIVANADTLIDDDPFDLAIIADEHATLAQVSNVISLSKGRRVAVFAPLEITRELTPSEDVVLFDAGVNRLSIFESSNDFVFLGDSERDKDGMRFVSQIRLEQMNVRDFEQGEVAYE